MRHKDRVAKKMKGLKRKKCSTRRHSRTYLTRRMGPHDESHTHQQPAAQAHRDHYSHGNATADTDTVDEKADATPTPAHRPTHKRHDDPPTTPPTATTSASEHDVYTTTAVPHAEPNNKCPARRTKKHTLPGPLGERRRSPLIGYTFLGTCPLSSSGTKLSILHSWFWAVHIPRPQEKGCAPCSWLAEWLQPQLFG